MTAPLTDARLDEIARYCSGNTFHEQAIRDLLTALAQCREEREAATRIGAEASAGLLEAYEGQVAHTDLVRAEYQKRLAAATAALAAAREIVGDFERELERDGIKRMALLTIDQPVGWIVLRLWDRLRALLAAPGQREEGT